MTKIPYGVADKHIKCSNGPDVDLMKFYCTQYGTDYGRRWENFQAGLVTHTGSGFVSNIRPQVYYNSRLDEIDNPGFGLICADTYSSITQRSYRRYAGSTGKETLPNTVHQTGSGYVREKPLHTAKESEVRETCVGGLLSLAPVDILPRHRPYLHRIQRKDPVEEENYGYGPGCMTTESKSRYQGQPMTTELGSVPIHGQKEETGYTHNHQVEPVTFHPDFTYKADYPGYLTGRPTGLSITKTHYLPFEYSKDREPLPRIAICSDKESGFSKGTKPYVAYGTNEAYDRPDKLSAARLEKIKKEDPVEYLNVMHPDNHSSVERNFLVGKQTPDRTLANLIGNESVGWKEKTGYTINNQRYVSSADNPAQFITDNMVRFADRRPIGKDREGHVWGGTHPCQPDGYTRSVTLHTAGPSYNPCTTLQTAQPYVTRSIQARDPFFDEHLYDSKKHTGQTLA